MISFQRLLGREAEFLELLAQSAREGCEAVAALRRMLAERPTSPTVHEFACASTRGHAITEQFTEKLLTTFVTPMEREDLEALALALCRIPRTVEKFAQRYRLVVDQVRDVDFSQQVALMDQAAQLVIQMVQGLRDGRDLANLKSLQARLQAVESQADDLLLDLMQDFYRENFPPLRAIILSDLYNLNEKVVDRCRDAGNVITHVVLKNS